MDKIILITGASSGIGEGLARELAGAGAKVLLGARRLDRIQAIATQIQAAGRHRRGPAAGCHLPSLHGRLRAGRHGPLGAR